MRADIALLLHESTGKGVSEFTSAGHSAVYVSGICMDTPTRLRLCKPDEEGSVIANYTGFGENQPYEWNIAPLTMYLYGVEDPKNIPLYGNADLRRLLQEGYRQKYLGAVCPQATCGAATSGAHWRDMVGSTFARDIYSFRVRTTVEQDAALVEEFNSLPNVNHYNGFTRNCADFARGLINRYFPGAAKPDHLNDFGMTSPKAITKSFAHYGEKRPELMFSAEKFSQLPGPIKRSVDCRKGTEVSFRSKKWIIPMLLRSHELAVFIAAYALTGRFNPQHDYEKYPTPHMAVLNLREAQLKAQGRTAELASIKEAKKAEREAVIGTREVWADYRRRFELILASAFHDGVFVNPREVKTYLRELDRQSRPELDANGAPILRIGESTVGLTRDTILAPGSDRLIAYKLMLSKVGATLDSSLKNRGTLPQFQSDWQILTNFQNIEQASSADPTLAPPQRAQ